jgi:hypothetical protein
MLFGGVNNYKGMAMRTAHANYDIHNVQYKAMIDCYTEAMLGEEIDPVDVEVLISKINFSKKEVLNE